MRILAIVAACVIVASCSSPKPKAPESVTAEPPVSTASVEPTGPHDPTVGLDKGKADVGKEYFYGENRGRCLKCHTLNGQGEPGTWDLGDTGLRHDPVWLAIFIDNPRNKRPEVARMAPFRGDPKATIADVVAFLMTLKTPVEHPPHTDVKPPDEPDTWKGGVGGRGGGSAGGSDL